jgi:transcription termination factor Rho
MDLMTPLGMGQRGLIVAPPRTGKTTLLHHIADAVAKNHPEVILIILLVDERPEEVTDFRRSHPTAELMASSNDADIKSHTRISQLAIERANKTLPAGACLPHTARLADRLFLQHEQTPWRTTELVRAAL